MPSTAVLVVVVPHVRHLIAEHVMTCRGIRRIRCRRFGEAVGRYGAAAEGGWRKAGFCATATKKKKKKKKNAIKYTPHTTAGVYAPHFSDPLLFLLPTRLLNESTTIYLRLYTVCRHDTVCRGSVRTVHEPRPTFAEGDGRNPQTVCRRRISFRFHETFLIHIHILWRIYYYVCRRRRFRTGNGSV